MQNKNLTV